MSGTGECSADFAGEERAFRIRLGEIRRIEAKCGAGIGEVVRRLARAVVVMARVGGAEALAQGVEIHADDVHETLYQGLLGAGMPGPEASKLMRQEVGDRGFRGILDNAEVALAVLMGTQRAPEGEPEGEPKAAAATATPKSRRTSKSSTEPARPSA